MSPEDRALSSDGRLTANDDADDEDEEEGAPLALVATAFCCLLFLRRARFFRFLMVLALAAFD